MQSWSSRFDLDLTRVACDREWGGSSLRAIVDGSVSPQSLGDTARERLHAMQVIPRTSVLESIGTKVVGMDLEKVASRIAI